MNPAEKYHALKALKHGVDAAVREAQAEAEAYAATVRAKTLVTDYGQVTVVTKRPTITLDEAGLLAWVKKHAPTEVIESVRPAYAEQYRRGLRVVDGEAVDGDGCVVGFATVGEAVTYLKADLDADTKSEAEEYAAQALGSLLRREVSRG